MTRQEIVIRWDGRPRRVTVEGIVFRGQLVVHRRISELTRRGPEYHLGCWQITHIPTGALMSGWLPSDKDAIKRVRRAFALHRDWSRTTPETIERWPKAKRAKLKRALGVL